MNDQIINFMLTVRKMTTFVKTRISTVMLIIKLAIAPSGFLLSAWLWLPSLSRPVFFNKIIIEKIDL